MTTPAPVLAVIDFTFVRAEAARFHTRNGNESVDPIPLTKLMFLLFFDDVPSECELAGRGVFPKFTRQPWAADYSAARTVVPI